MRIFLFFGKILQYRFKGKKTIHWKKIEGFFCDAYIHQFRSPKESNGKICDGNNFSLKKQKFTTAKIISNTVLGIYCKHV